MSDINDLQKELVRVRDERDWLQFHTPKDLAMSVAIEAAELMEHFQWKNAEEVLKHIKTDKAQEIEEEIADVFIYLMYLADVLNIDLAKITAQKIKKIEKRLPVEKTKGTHKKYTELN